MSQKYSKDVTLCPGYDVTSVTHSEDGLGLRATLRLAGKAADAFGKDVRDLVLDVEYQSTERLHVHIYDAEENQYQIPSKSFPRPPSSPSSPVTSPALEFHHTPSPFAFWITRRSPTGSTSTIFDTRPTSIPLHLDTISVDGKEIIDSATPAYPLVFSDQYLQVATAVPEDTNIYGLGEVIATSGFRRDNHGSMTAMWTRDSAGVPTDSNLYGVHPFYVEVRPPSTSSTGAKAEAESHGVFMLNSHGMDVLTRTGVIEYRIIGGTLDMYFLSGPTPIKVIEQYSEIVGKPAQMPYWTFGLHMCRWGWKSIEETKGVVEKMEKAGIPLETVWNDLDYMDRYRNFEVNDKFSPKQYKAFVDWLHSRGQHYVPIVDAAIGVPKDSSDPYNAYDTGSKMGVFINNEDGSEFVGKVWPGPTVFPDWTHPQVVEWWQAQFDAFHKICPYDGIWLDMNEPASFSSAPIEGDSSIVQITEKDASGRPMEETKESREAHDTEGANGTVANGVNGTEPPIKRSKKEVNTYDVPPYSIHNDYPSLGSHTVGPRCRLADGSLHYNAHNLFGYTENLVTHEVLTKQDPVNRPFILSRSSFAGLGRVSAHWLGDNYSTWKSMRESIQGVLQFQLFQAPMVGPDACGFGEDATEELCNRWMQLCAFYPFFRNHNALDPTSQEPYLWTSVAEASKRALEVRYQLLPHWETLFAQANAKGTPPMRALFFEFASPELLSVEHQFLVGSSLLVTPVLHEGEKSVTGVFPSDGGTEWRDWWTHELLKVDKHDKATLPTPLGHINVHVRSGSIILVHPKPAYTLAETRKGGYSLVIHLDKRGEATGEAVLDDGMSVKSESTHVSFSVKKNTLTISSSGTYSPSGKIEGLSIFNAGITFKSERVAITLDGKPSEGTDHEVDENTGSLKVRGLAIGLGGEGQDTAVGW